MLIKICGITRREDALAAVDAGAGAIGFILWPDSPRSVEIETARTIAAALPAFVTTVGVFVNQPAEYVRDVADRIRLSAVQLHGDEPVAYLDVIAVPVIKAIVDEAGADAWPVRVTPLVEARDPARRGGTGRLADWGAAASLARRRRILLAGGLTPDNVEEAVARVHPFGIDVSSGVESAPGVKDHDRMRALVAAARRATEGVK